MFKVLHDKFGNSLRAEYVDGAIEVKRVNPYTGEISKMNLGMMMQDLIDFYDPRIPRDDKYHYLSYQEKEFLDSGVIR
jgi:hypothetical protein